MSIIFSIINCVQGDGGDDCDLIVTNITDNGKYGMFESVTQPGATQSGTHIGVPPTGLITSTDKGQRIDASLFRVVRIIVSVYDFIIILPIEHYSI